MLLFDKTKFIFKYYLLAFWHGNSNVNSGNQNCNKVYTGGSINFGDENLNNGKQF